MAEGDAVPKTYLVTGAAGFVGSHFSELLLQQDDVTVLGVDNLTYAASRENRQLFENNARYRFFECDITDYQAVNKVFQCFNVDVVVNFAAETHVDRSIVNPEVFMRTNVMGTWNVLQCAKEAWSDGAGGFRPAVKFVQVSTDEVYGDAHLQGNIAADEKALLCPSSPYAASKASADLLVLSYFRTYCMPVCVVRSSNNYGPRQHPEKLIPLMFNNCMRGRALPIYGDGLQTRDWLYVKDNCQAIELVAQSGRPGEVYNVGTGRKIANLDLVNRIIEFAGKRSGVIVSEESVRHVADRLGHDREYLLNSEKIRRELGWKSVTNFEEGLERTLRWYMDNPDWLEHAAGSEYEVYYQRMYEI